MKMHGMTIYAAAKLIGVHQSSVYSAVSRDKLRAFEGRLPCPCCGTSVFPESLNREVLIDSARQSIEQRQADGR